MEYTGDNMCHESVKFDAWKCGSHYRRVTEPNTSKALIEVGNRKRIVLSNVLLDSLRQIEWSFERIMGQTYWFVPAIHYLGIYV